MHDYPLSIDSGIYQGGHCQGIALDRKNGWMYYSFTTLLVKTDLAGRFLGSVTGLTGHLGCISFNDADGCVYGSLEYQNDAIGKGIRHRLGREDVQEDAFYMAIFDGKRMTEAEMDAQSSGIMRAAYLKDVTDDYNAVVTLPDGSPLNHRGGCSGIDGTAIGPMFGEPANSEPVLTVAYGIYGDTARTDNDYQILLSYSLDDLNAQAKPLDATNMHHKGPVPIRRTYAYTGNTTYGIQNLEYDPRTGNYLAAVYLGKKDAFPNLPLYAFRQEAAPVKMRLAGVYPETEGECLTLAEGPAGGKSGITGWTYEWGQTGLYAFGDGRYYISYDEKTETGWKTIVRLCHYDKDTYISL